MNPLNDKFLENSPSRSGDIFPILSLEKDLTSTSKVNKADKDNLSAYVENLIFILDGIALLKNFLNYKSKLNNDFLSINGDIDSDFFRLFLVMLNFSNEYILDAKSCKKIEKVDLKNLYSNLVHMLEISRKKNSISELKKINKDVLVETSNTILAIMMENRFTNLNNIFKVSGCIYSLVESENFLGTSAKNIAFLRKINIKVDQENVKFIDILYQFINYINHVHLVIKKVISIASENNINTMNIEFEIFMKHYYLWYNRYQSYYAYNIVNTFMEEKPLTCEILSKSRLFYSLLLNIKSLGDIHDVMFVQKIVNKSNNASAYMFLNDNHRILTVKELERDLQLITKVIEAKIPQKINPTLDTDFTEILIELKNLIDDLSACYDSEGQLKVDFSFRIHYANLVKEKVDALLYLLEECVKNTVKHSESMWSHSINNSGVQMLIFNILRHDVWNIPRDEMQILVEDFYEDSVNQILGIKTIEKIILSLDNFDDKVLLFRKFFSGVPMIMAEREFLTSIDNIISSELLLNAYFELYYDNEEYWINFLTQDRALFIAFDTQLVDAQKLLMFLRYLIWYKSTNAEFDVFEHIETAVNQLWRFGCSISSDEIMRTKASLIDCQYNREKCLKKVKEKIISKDPFFGNNKQQMLEGKHIGLYEDSFGIIEPKYTETGRRLKDLRALRLSVNNLTIEKSETDIKNNGLKIYLFLILGVIAIAFSLIDLFFAEIVLLGIFIEEMALLGLFTTTLSSYIWRKNKRSESRLDKKKKKINKMIKEQQVHRVKIQDLGSNNPMPANDNIEKRKKINEGVFADSNEFK
jgi:hypothetical protein